jgi:hypothetical protein
MSFRNSVTIIASPRPRVGKTLLARLLTDFHRQEGRAVQAFDLNSGAATLSQFLPEWTIVSEIDDIAGQMALFDRMIADDGVNKVVDLGAAAFESFFAVVQKIGFTEEARRRGIATAILYFVSPDATSVETYRSLSGRLPAASMVPVQNDILGSGHYRDKYRASGGDAAVVRLPLLAAATRKFTDRPPFSFADGRVAGATAPEREIGVDLQHWLRKIHLEFHELELRLLLADLNASIQLSP